MDQPLTPCEFGIGDVMPHWSGFATGDKWNGFDVVCVTPATRDRIAGYMRVAFEHEPDVLTDLFGMPFRESDGQTLYELSGWQTFVLSREDRLVRTAQHAADRHARRVGKWAWRAVDYREDPLRPVPITPEQDRLMAQAFALSQRLYAELDAIV